MIFCGSETTTERSEKPARTAARPPRTRPSPAADIHAAVFAQILEEAGRR
jgi:hypothetical protein